jgi:hypothetical protein
LAVVAPDLTTFQFSCTYVPIDNAASPSGGNAKFPDILVTIPKRITLQKHKKKKT